MGGMVKVLCTNSNAPMKPSRLPKNWKASECFVSTWMRKATDYNSTCWGGAQCWFGMP